LPGKKKKEGDSGRNKREQQGEREGKEEEEGLTQDSAVMLTRRRTI